MLEIKNTEVYNLENALKASGYPLRIGDPDLSDTNFSRGTKLGSCKSGSGQDNFLTGILVSCDIKYPQYWSMEAERYHFLQIVSSQSKQHCLIKAMTDENPYKYFNKYVDTDIIDIVGRYVDDYNQLLQLGNKDDIYKAFMKIMSNLPMGYELWMHITTNYEQLKTIYNQRHNHKLKEDWGYFCDWILSLPHFSELTGIQNKYLVESKCTRTCSDGQPNGFTEAISCSILNDVPKEEQGSGMYVMKMSENGLPQGVMEVKCSAENKPKPKCGIKIFEGSKI